MSRIAVEGASLVVYTAAEAAVVMQTARWKIDGACATGALAAVDETPPTDKMPNRRRSWRILESDLIAWHRSGRPLTPEARAGG